MTGRMRRPPPPGWYAVSPYIAPNPHDRGLAPLLAELTAGQAGC